MESAFAESLEAVYLKRVGRAHELVEKLSVRLLDLQSERVDLVRLVQDLALSSEQSVGALKGRFEALLGDLEAFYDATLLRVSQQEAARKAELTRRLQNLERNEQQLKEHIQHLQLQVRTQPKTKFVQHFLGLLRTTEALVSEAAPEQPLPPDFTNLSVPLFDVYVAPDQEDEAEAEDEERISEWQKPTERQQTEQ